MSFTINVMRGRYALMLSFVESLQVFPITQHSRNLEAFLCSPSSHPSLQRVIDKLERLIATGYFST